MRKTEYAGKRATRDHAGLDSPRAVAKLHFGGYTCCNSINQSAEGTGSSSHVPKQKERVPMVKLAAIEEMSDPRKVAADIQPGRDFVRAQELADYLQVSTGFVYKLAREKRIPCVHIGRSVRFDIDSVERTLGQQRFLR